ncbi:MAG: hypothetical protein WC139_07085 [Candidatus Kapaibacterium sp.]
MLTELLGLKDYKVASVDAHRNMIEHIPDVEFKKAILLQIDKAGLTNKECEFLSKISDRWIKEIHEYKEISIMLLPADKLATH